MEETLKLGRQNHVDEDARQQESDDQTPGRFVKNLYGPGEVHAIAGMRHPIDGRAGSAHRRIKGKVGFVIGCQSYLKLAIVAVDGGWTDAALECGDIVQPDLAH